jgi:hypothetical protein
MLLDVRGEVSLDWRQQENLNPEVESHAEKHERSAQHSAVPERQADAQPLKQCCTWLS